MFKDNETPTWIYVVGFVVLTLISIALVCVIVENWQTMPHHLKKTFSEKEILFIEIMHDRKKSKIGISKELNCSFERVKRQIEIINFRKQQNEKAISNRNRIRNGILPKT